MSRKRPLHLFDATGVELEYMIVDRETLSVRPLADELLKKECGAYESEIELGDIAWCNELALHVIELKTNGPVASLDGLDRRFQEHVGRVTGHLETLDARLMPGGMHPWMDPDRELRLWPHEYSPVYDAFNRIFDCRGHGWANLQSVHVNLPFHGDDEFGRLHAALRVVLPILPAIAASSPVADGRATGFLDTRLEVYRSNAKRVPSVSGSVIPEPVFDRATYEGELLSGIYEELRPLDPAGILRYEWVNARGCIARFDRGSIEIRVLDVQECPRADVAITAVVVGVVKALADGELSDPVRQRRWPTEDLAAIFLEAVREADEARITDAEYLATLGYPSRGPCTLRDLWSHLVERVASREPAMEGWRDVLGTILRDGCLSRRILRALGGDDRHGRLWEVYGELCRCLEDGRPFRAGS